jgi:hypothetical protein
MMEMDEEFLETNDLDWFASCSNGALAHFATGGRGFVPEPIKKSISEYEMAFDYFSSLPEDFGFEVVEKNLPVFKNFALRDHYLKSFVEMAKKGLFSYDVSEVGYKLIARPVSGVRYAGLPSEIRRVVHVLLVGSCEVIGVEEIF